MEEDCIVISDDECDEPELVKELYNLEPPVIDLTDDETHQQHSTQPEHQRPSSPQQHRFEPEPPIFNPIIPNWQNQQNNQNTSFKNNQQSLFDNPMFFRPQFSYKPKPPPTFPTHPPQTFFLRPNTVFTRYTFPQPQSEPQSEPQSQPQFQWQPQSQRQPQPQPQPPSPSPPPSPPRHSPSPPPNQSKSDQQEPQSSARTKQQPPLFQKQFIYKPREKFTPRKQTLAQDNFESSTAAPHGSSPTPPSNSPQKRESPFMCENPSPQPPPAKQKSPIIPRQEPTQNILQQSNQQPKQQQAPIIDDKELMMTQKALGNEKYKRNQFDEAIRIYKRANELANKLGDTEMSAILHFNLAMTYCKLRSYDQAIDECANAVKLNDKYMKAHLKRAEIFHRQYKFDEAIICYEHICELDNTNQDYKILLNKAKEAAKHTKKRDFHSILGLRPNFTVQELKKAYRQQALKHHPDRHSDADIVTRRIQEKHFKDASEAHTFIQKRFCNY